MNGKELLISALRGEATERPAWMPLVSKQSLQLVEPAKRDGYTIFDPNVIVEAQTAAANRYRADGIPVVFALATLSHVTGCQIRWDESFNVAAVGHPLEDRLEDHFKIPQFDSNHLFYRNIGEATRRLVSTIGDNTAIYGLATGPLSLLADWRNANNLLMDFYDNPEHVKGAIRTAMERTISEAEFYIANGVHVAAIVDPGIANLGPDLYDEFVKPVHTEIFRRIGSKTNASLFSCGTVSQHIKSMAETGCMNITVDINVPCNILIKYALQRGVSFGGGIDQLQDLKRGPLDAQGSAVLAMDAAGKKGYILSPGCDPDFDTNPAHFEAIGNMLHAGNREYLMACAKDHMRNRKIEYSGFPDPHQGYRYTRKDVVVIDVITANSKACQPCDTAMRFVQRVAQRAELEQNAAFEVYEHPTAIPTSSGPAMAHYLRAQQILAVFVDGVFTPVSYSDGRHFANVLRERAVSKAK